MPRPTLKVHEALFLALAPAVVLLAVLTAARAVDLGSAAALAALVGGGAWWFARRGLPDGPAKTGTQASPAALTPAELLEHLPDPVILLSRGREIVAINRPARDLLGVGSLGRDLALSLRHPSVLAAVDTVLSGVPSLSEEIVLPVPLEQTFTLHAAGLAASPEASAPAVILVFHDETRAKRAEQSRADFVANASHELRSPLSALIGFIETLRGPARDDTEARERFLEIMRTEAQRMARLVEDLLSLSRVEINEHVPPRNRVDLDEVLASVRDALAARASDKAMTIEIDCPEDLPPVIGEADQLTQVFHNLVDNAVKYGRPGTPVRVLVRSVGRLPGTDAPGVEVSVVDRGEGIAGVHVPRITERFYRIDEGRSRKLGGTGLGLAIVKHIVNRHRGVLKIESRVGEGSAFTVTLPAASVPAKAAQPPARRAGMS